MTDSSAAVPPKNVAIVLSGGGARAAYQVGLLRCLAKVMPDYRFQIITGVSAGAINASFIASHPGGIESAAEELTALWSQLTVDQIFRSEGSVLARTFGRWATRLLSGGTRLAPTVRGMVDTTPLLDLLRRNLDADSSTGEIPGITANIESGGLKSIALTTLNYSTGETVTWVQGRDITTWARSNRRSFNTRLTPRHVLASAALPMFFPAVKLPDGWHGDGGIRLAAPLSPAVHLGASRILAISTRYQRQEGEQQDMDLDQYPPPAQILGKLMNAIFLDILDQDAERLMRINELIRKVPKERLTTMREIDIMVLRPSVDLGRLSAQFEPQLPKAFRFFTRGLGTKETKSPDFLSLLMFQPDYLKHLIQIGEEDAQARLPEIKKLLLGEEKSLPEPATAMPTAEQSES